METMGERIKRLRLEHNMTQEELGGKVGLKRAAINKYEKGNVENMKRSTISKMSTLFNVSPIYLMAMDDELKETTTLMQITETSAKLKETQQKEVLEFAKNKLEIQNHKVVQLKDHPVDKKRNFQENKHAVDIHGILSAGYGAKNFDKESPIKVVFLDRIPSNYDLAFEVRGNSMCPTFIDGEIVFIRKKQEIYSGMIGAVEINGEAFLKKLFEERNRLKLISLNRDIDETGKRLYPDFYADEFDDIHLIGKVLN